VDQKWGEPKRLPFFLCAEHDRAWGVSWLNVGLEHPLSRVVPRAIVRKPALKGARAQHASGDPLHQPHRRASEIPVDDERGANVQRAARESGPQDCEER